MNRNKKNAVRTMKTDVRTANHVSQPVKSESCGFPAEIRDGDDNRHA